MQSIHITTLRKILSSPEPIDIRLWTRSGEIQSWHRCISLKYDFYKGTRRMKLLDSNEIRQLRDVCIFEVNGIEVYMELFLYNQSSLIKKIHQGFLLHEDKRTDTFL